MEKKGFALIEMLIVIAIIGILVGVGGISIKKQAESRAMLRVQNELGDFFRVAAKGSQETGKRYGINFDLVGENIEIYREENEDGEWEDGGARRTIEELKLPKVLEYGIKWGTIYDQDFNSEIKSEGYLNKNFTMYIFTASLGSGIGDNEEVKYAISFSFDDHIKYLHVREYLPVGVITSKKILDEGMSPSENPNLKLIRD